MLEKAIEALVEDLRIDNAELRLECLGYQQETKPLLANIILSYQHFSGVDEYLVYVEHSARPVSRLQGLQKLRHVAQALRYVQLGATLVGVASS